MPKIGPKELQRRSLQAAVAERLAHSPQQSPQAPYGMLAELLEVAGLAPADPAEIIRALTYYRKHRERQRDGQRARRAKPQTP